ncbi:ParA family protein [Paracoccus sp. SM22M-07]|uniref:ParA family protein n=1 Tax=Paracoccus sp. SM22M-07 TaxID=1520813 RepID=UPI00090F7668|nr:ParA family protein [Paracoccus sp. SM22M-07]OJH43397.1 hypothetical protein IE00_16540 [Paracoccus sp. SM22M-07]
MAKILSLMHKKGGAGKSTVAKLMASAFLFKDAKVLLIDMDENGDYLGWWQRAVENGLSSDKLSARFAEDSKALFEIINNNEDDFDIIIVDTKGEAIGYADDLAGASDALIMPCMNSKADRERAAETLKWHDDLRARASDPSDIPPIFVVMTRVAAPLFTHIEGTPKPAKIASREFERHYEIINQFDPLKTMIPENPRYREMDEQGTLGAIIQKLRNSDNPSDRMSLVHWETAMAHSINLINNIYSGERLRAKKGERAT